MKAYMGYDRPGGPREGACLIFAPNTKAARKRAWDVLSGWYGTEWIDVATQLLRDLPDHLRELDNGAEQTIESPPTCPTCNMWGGELYDDGCDLCGGEGTAAPTTAAEDGKSGA